MEYKMVKRKDKKIAAILSQSGCYISSTDGYYPICTSNVIVRYIAVNSYK
jgi:uncharacterized protein with FMN-binding domain